jgi:hypothetical protein
MVEVKAGMRVRSQEGARDLPPAGLIDTPLESAHDR